MVALNALDVMREGHDCSRVGIFLRDLTGSFEDIKDDPSMPSAEKIWKIARMNISWIRAFASDADSAPVPVLAACGIWWRIHRLSRIAVAVSRILKHDNI
jgi:hypothetical protein